MNSSHVGGEEHLTTNVPSSLPERNDGPTDRLIEVRIIRLCGRIAGGMAAVRLGWDVEVDGGAERVRQDGAATKWRKGRGTWDILSQKSLRFPYPLKDGNSAIPKSPNPMPEESAPSPIDPKAANLANLITADKKAAMKALLTAYTAKFHPGTKPAWGQIEHSRFILFALNRFIEIPDAARAPLFDLLQTCGLGGNASQFAQHFADDKNGALLAPSKAKAATISLALE